MTTTNTRSEALRLAELLELLEFNAKTYIAHDAAATLRTLAQQSERDEALMQQALEALETISDALQNKVVQMRTGIVIGGFAVEQTQAAITELRERLSEQK